MKAVWHLLIFEVRRLAAPLVVCALMLVAWWVFLWRLSKPDLEIDYSLWQASYWSGIAGLLVMFLALCVWLGLGHPSRRSDAFWRTRPEFAGHLLMAKSAFIAGVLAMWLMVRFLAFVTWGIPWLASIEMAWSGAVPMLLPGLLVVGLASLAGSWTRLFVVLGFVGAIGFGCFLVFGVMSESELGGELILGMKRMFARGALSGENGKILSPWDYSRIVDRVWLTLTLVVAVTLWLEYRTRRTRLMVAVFSGGLVATLLVAVSTPPVPTVPPVDERGELFARVKKIEPVRRNVFYNHQPAEIVQLTVEIPSWDGRGQLNLVNSFPDDTWLSGLGADGRNHRVKVYLKPAGVWAIGDSYALFEKELAPIRLVDREKPTVQSATQGSVFLKTKAYLVATQARELGIRSGVLSGQLAAYQKEVGKTGETSLDSPSAIASHYSATRFGKPNVVEKSSDGRLVRIRGLYVGVGPNWRVPLGRMTWRRFSHVSSVAIGTPSGLSVVVVHPDGLHARRVRLVNEGGVAAFGWWRSEFSFELPLEGEDGSEFPRIQEADAAKMKVISYGVDFLHRYKVTIPDTPWELPDLSPVKSDSR